MNADDQPVIPQPPLGIHPLLPPTHLALTNLVGICSKLVGKALVVKNLDVEWGLVLKVMQDASEKEMGSVDQMKAVLGMHTSSVMPVHFLVVFGGKI